jgi:hypothetical protein
MRQKSIVYVREGERKKEKREKKEGDVEILVCLCP